MQESASGLQGQIEYATDLFDASTVERLSEHLVRLLEGVVACPESRISQLPLLGEAERQRLLVHWNDTAREYPQRCVQELFSEQAARTPGAPAVIFGEQQLSYAELEARSNQLAHHLVSLGVGPEVIVGLCVERSIEMVVGLLGILKAGGAYLPLDPQYPRERLEYMLQDTAAAVVLTPLQVRDALPKHAGVTVNLDGDWSLSGREPVSEPLPCTQAGHLAYVIYTSGSTGRPKAVGVTHGNVANLLHHFSATLALSRSDTMLAITPLTFDIAGLELYLPLICGGRIVLASRADVLAPERLSGLIRTHSVTMLQATPATWRMLQSNEAQLSLTAALCGGEAIDADLAKYLREVGARAYNVYGPTETTIWSTVSVLADGKRLSLGQPIANTQIYILDESLNLVPVGVIGEVHIAGAGVARGYLNRASLTAERFIPDPFGSAGERLYRTGDLARWTTDGELEFIGRVDHQVKIRGFRIELGEVESVLLEHAAVREAVVVAREGATYTSRGRGREAEPGADGERAMRAQPEAPGDKRLVAYVVGATGQDAPHIPQVAELQAYLRQRLPQYMVPSAWVVLERLPLNANGKVDRQGLPAPEGRSEDSAYVAPRNATEQLLAQIWSEVLRVSRISVHDNFFVLGGDSLRAIRVIARMRQMFGLEASVRLMFELPTIATFAERMGEMKRNAKPELPPLTARRKRSNC
jgi:amino acid adenylation domain-containing protein